MASTSSLLTVLAEQDISAKAHKDGVLILDPDALLQALDKRAGAAQERPLDPKAANPVGALQEHCQAQGKPLPVYDFESTGTVNAPSFCCTARALGKEGAGSGPSKNQAKVGAARALLGALQAGRSVRHG